MKNQDKLILMISSPYGHKYYNINLLLKHIFIYFITFIGMIVFFVFIILYLFSSEINEIEQKYNYIQERYKNLVNKHLDLTSQIADEKEEMLLTSDRIEELEDTIGINDKNSNIALENRVEIASITGLQKLFIMKFVPNGFPLASYKRISSPYGYRINPLSNAKEFHPGVDLAADKGSPVYATADGVVEFSKDGWNGGYGTLVKLDHSFGFKTYYAHLSATAVKKGDFVRKGQLIAYVGSTGMSSGNHLHYEVRFLGSHISPINFLEWNMSNFNEIFNKEKDVAWQSLLTMINSLMQQTSTGQQLSLLGQN